MAGKLVIAGAHVAAADPHGITAAHLAAERGFAGSATQRGNAVRDLQLCLPRGAKCGG